MELLLYAVQVATPHSHYDFDVGLVLTEFPSTL